MAQSALRICKICERGYGNNFCFDCEQYLCNNCKKYPNRLKFSKNHQFGSDLNHVPEVISKCKAHKDKFIFLCIECDAPLCRRCISGHKGHEISNIDDVICELKESIITSTKSKAKQTEDVILRLNGGLRSLESDEKAIIKKMKEEGSNLKEFIDREVEKKVFFLKGMLKQQKTKLNCLLSEARELKEKEQQLLLHIGDLQQGQDDVTLLKKLKTHMDEIDKIERLTIERLPFITYVSTSFTDENIPNMLGTVTIHELTDNIRVTNWKPETKSKSPRSETQRPETSRSEIPTSQSPISETLRLNTLAPTTIHKYLYKCGYCGWYGKCRKKMYPYCPRCYSFCIYETRH